MWPANTHLALTGDSRVGCWRASALSCAVCSDLLHQIKLLLVCLSPFHGDHLCFVMGSEWVLFAHRDPLPCWRYSYVGSGRQSGGGTLAEGPDDRPWSRGRGATVPGNSHPEPSISPMLNSVRSPWVFLLVFSQLFLSCLDQSRELEGKFLKITSISDQKTLGVNSVSLSFSALFLGRGKGKSKLRFHNIHNSLDPRWGMIQETKGGNTVFRL